MSDVVSIFEFISKHWNLVELLISAISDKGVDPVKVRDAIELEMTRKADEDMRRELGP